MRVESLVEAGGASVWDFGGATGCQAPSNVNGCNVAASAEAPSLFLSMKSDSCPSEISYYFDVE